MRQAETLPSMQQRQSERAYRGADALSCSVQAREEEQATAEAEAPAEEAAASETAE